MGVKKLSGKRRVRPEIVITHTTSKSGKSAVKTSGGFWVLVCLGRTLELCLQWQQPHFSS